MAEQEIELLVIFTDLNMQLEQEGGEMVWANVRKRMWDKQCEKIEANKMTEMKTKRADIGCYCLFSSIILFYNLLCIFQDAALISCSWTELM